MKYNRITGYVGALGLSALLSAPALADSRGGHGEGHDEDGEGRKRQEARLRITG